MRVNSRMVRIAGAAMLALLLAMTTGPVAAQDGEGEPGLTSVCVQGFEEPIHVEYLTDEQITEIEQQVDDPSEPPGPEIVGYPDPETGSCATENGELKEYDPEVSTPICVPSGLQSEGPLVVQFVSNQYLPAYNDPILADPETGACPVQESAGDGDDSTDDGTADDGAVADNDSAAVSELPDTGAGVAAQQQGLSGLAALLAVSASMLLAGGLFVQRNALRRR